jgi:hypothetical protein
MKSKMKAALIGIIIEITLILHKFTLKNKKCIK